MVASRLAALLASVLLLASCLRAVEPPEHWDGGADVGAPDSSLPGDDRDAGDDGGASDSSTPDNDRDAGADVGASDSGTPGDDRDAGDDGGVPDSGTCTCSAPPCEPCATPLMERCEGQDVFRCSDWNTDGCPFWRQVDHCSGQEECHDFPRPDLGYQRAGCSCPYGIYCQPGDTRCNGAVLERCRDADFDAMSCWSVVTCPQGQACVDGACAP